MGKTVNIVVTCTSRKTRDSARALSCTRRARARPSKTAHRTGSNGLALMATRRPSRSQLYCGEYWSVVRSLPAVARDSGLTARIWICSAGYGLISPESQICSYSATFSPYERDSVTRGFDADARRSAAQQWWQQYRKVVRSRGQRIAESHCYCTQVPESAAVGRRVSRLSAGN